MSENKQRFIYVDGEEIAVSRNIYLEYMRPIWAERKRRERESRCRDENGSRCLKDCRLCDRQRDGGILSLDKRIEDGYDAADPLDLSELIAETLLKDELRKAIAGLTEDERKIIDIAFQGKPEREAAAEIGLHRNTFVYRRDKIVDKLKKILNV